jgi:DNA-binding SARP family transcriptional activator
LIHEWLVSHWVADSAETFDATDRLRIRVLGPVRVLRAGSVAAPITNGQRAVLGLLALAAGRPMNRAQLVDGLWGQDPPPTASNVIQTHIKHLRRLLEPDRRSRAPSVLLPNVGDGYALRIPAEDVDALRFQVLLGRAAGLDGPDRPHRTVALLAEALRLWHGAPCADVPALKGNSRVLALVEQGRLAQMRFGAALLAAGCAAEAVLVLEDAVAARPLDEAGQAVLVAAYHAAGRRGEAFNVYHRIRGRLIDELGVDPGPELAAAHDALLNGAGTAPAVRPEDYVR